MFDKKIAFIMPIYPPHYDYARAFLKSWRRFQMPRQADLFFVFSSAEEAALFAEAEQKIVMPADIMDECLRRDSGIINVKKFYAINELKDRFKYLIVIDAESIILRSLNLLDLCERYFKDKILYGNYARKDVLTVVNSCLSYFPQGKAEIFDRRLYLWFNQLCIYKTDNLNDFFAQTGIFKDIAALGRKDFDYYIYMLYLIFYQGFRVKNIGIVVDYGFCEDVYGNFEFTSDDYKSIPFRLATQNTESRLPTSLRQKILLRIQTDRTKRERKKLKKQRKELIKKYVKTICQSIIKIFKKIDKKYDG